mmetsp:Transcript_139940/g.390123  ORF Transcript_139940/g.390123 Transcript_139940/m.390123 type:complete len:346 (-) Transcript_139940:71-1108(-)
MWVGVQGLSKRLRHHSSFFAINLDTSESQCKLAKELFGLQSQLMVLPHILVLIELGLGCIQTRHEFCNLLLGTVLGQRGHCIDLPLPHLKLSTCLADNAQRRLHCPFRVSDGTQLQLLELLDRLHCQWGGEDGYLLDLVLGCCHPLLHLGQHGLETLGVFLLLLLLGRRGSWLPLCRWSRAGAAVLLTACPPCFRPDALRHGTHLCLSFGLTRPRPQSGLTGRKACTRALRWLLDTPGLPCCSSPLVRLIPRQLPPQWGFAFACRIWHDLALGPSLALGRLRQLLLPATLLLRAVRRRLLRRSGLLIRPCRLCRPLFRLVPTCGLRLLGCSLPTLHHCQRSQELV